MSAPPLAGSAPQTSRATAATLGVAVVVAVGVALFLSPRLASLVADPGRAVRWGSPVIDAIHALALTVTIGALVLATVAVPFATPASARALRVATSAAAAWTLSAVGVLVLTYANVSGTSPSEPAFGPEFGRFIVGFELGQSLLVTVVLAGLATTAAAAATGPRSTALATGLALAGLLPLALGGHSGSAVGHETAVTALGLHLLGIAVWVGGLVTLVLLRPVMDGQTTTTVVGRFSGLALAAVVLVSISGVLNASTRLASWTDLGSRYGLLLCAKTALIIVLVALGWWHRQRTVPQLRSTRTAPFWRLVAVELTIMAVILGVAVAVSRTAPPVSDADSPADWTTAEVLIGAPMPPEQTFGRLLTLWRPDLLWVCVVLALGAAYLLGVRRLRQRGDSWPLWRTVVWLAGLTVVLLVTSSGLAAYGRVLFSTHMLQHMTMGMVAPLLLVPAAPITLALRTLTPRRDGSRGAREWLLWGLHSPVSRVLTHPMVAAGMLTASLLVFYFSPLFGISLRTHYGHEAMHAHFLIVGYLFVWSLVGTDPGVRATPYPLRLLILFATMAFHAFFGVALMGSTVVLQPEWFETVFLDRGWGADPLTDQRYGAALAWGIGEVPTIVLAILVAFRWVTDDTREARRRDRKADRDGEADLNAYNDMLTRLAKHR